MGIVHAQCENPINGREGKEKWVITNLAVIPSQAGKGIGSQLLKAIEGEALKHEVKKMFVHINLGDERIINFYLKMDTKKPGQLKTTITRAQQFSC